MQMHRFCRVASGRQNSCSQAGCLGGRDEGTHVKVTANEVHIVLLQKPMKSVKKISGCITFLGNDIVNVY